MIRIQTTNQHMTRGPCYPEKHIISPPPTASRAAIPACAARVVSGQPKRDTCPFDVRLNVLNPFNLSFIQLSIKQTIGDSFLLNPAFNIHIEHPLDLVLH